MPQLTLSGQAAEVDLVPGEDLFAILGVESSASDSEIRAAYRRRARVLHPDVNAAAGATRDFRRLSAAAEILLSPRREQWGSDMAEWPTDNDSTAWSTGDASNEGWAATAKSWGPVFSAVIGPWLSWYAFVALDQFGVGS